jgi:hypothetical protein
MSLLLFLYLLSGLALLSLILILKVNAHQYLVLFERLHLVEIFVIKAASDYSITAFFLIV